MDGVPAALEKRFNDLPLKDEVKKEIKEKLSKITPAKRAEILEKFVKDAEVKIKEQIEKIKKKEQKRQLVKKQLQIWLLRQQSQKQRRPHLKQPQRKLRLKKQQSQASPV